MKKNVFFFLTLLSLAFMARAYNFSAVCSTGQTLYYNINTSGTTCYVTYPGSYSYDEYARPSGNLSIPATVDYNGTTYSVISIGDDAFSECNDLTSVTIPNSVTSIGQSAFWNCSGLTSVTIPNSVTSIGNWAFSGCSGLTSVTIPNSVTSIGRYAFGFCRGLTSVTIPNSVTSIGQSAFSGCTGLTSVTIPNSVTSIGQSAFWNCSGLTSVTIPNSVTSIGYYTFQNCTGLTSVTIPNSVTSIGFAAFYNCSGLTSVTIPNSVTSIGDYAFQYCSGLTSVRMLSSNPPSLGGSVFANTQISKVVEIPCGTLASYQQAWGTSYNYSEGFVDYTLTLQSNNNDWGSVSFVQQNGHDISCDGYAIFSATANDGYVFEKWNDGNTDNPRTVTLTSNATVTATFVPDSLLYSDASKTVVTGYIEGLSHAIIPNTVTSIANNAFRNCTTLTSITIPNSVRSIGGHSFYGCYKLTSVTIPNSVTSIGNRAFANCSNLTEITIPNSVRTLPLEAFISCKKLNSITIPNSVTTIETGVFANCQGLTSVTLPNSVTSIGERVFKSCINLLSINLSSSITSIMNETFRGCRQLTNVTIPNSVTSIGYAAFRDCSGLTSVTIGNSVTSIGSYAFYDCKTLTNVTIPNSVTSIGNRAFYNCTGLTRVTIDNSVTNIGDYAFYGCSRINQVMFGNSVTSIGDYAFSYCIGLTNVTIPNSVTNIGERAFIQCYGLANVTIGNAVTSIKIWAFKNCTSLTTVNFNVTNCTNMGSNSYPVFDGCTSLSTLNIGSNVTAIPAYAFKNCTALNNVTIPASVRSLADGVFAECSSLTNVEMKSTTPPTKSGNPFKNTPSDMVITVPCGSLSAYQAAWGTRYNFESAPGEVVVIETHEVCDSYTWPINGETYTETPATAPTVTTSEQGCSITATLNLTVKHGQRSHEYVEQCLPYTWAVNGKTYNKSGVKTYKSYTNEGCPIYDTLTLNIIKGYSNTVEVTSCVPYTWDVTGRTYNKSGVKTFKSRQPDADGCYTYDTLRLNIIKGYSNVVEVTSCVPYTWDVTGRTYNKSGVKTYKTPAGEDGCAFYDTLRLNIIKGYGHHEYVENCGPYYWDVMGKTYNKSGMKTYKSAPDADGCPTYDTLYLVVLNCDKSPDDNSQLSTLNSQLSIYPNPTTGLVHIDVKAGSENNFNSQLSTFNLTVEVLDLVGRRVALFENSTTLDLSGLAQGTYTLRITLPDGIAIRKVVKK